MQKQEAYYKSLLSEFIDNKLSPDEVNELLEFIQSQPALYNHLLNSEDIKNKLIEQAYNGNIDVSEGVSVRMKERLLAAIQDDVAGDAVSADAQVSLRERKPLFRLLAGHWRWMAAAVFVIAVTTAVVRFTNQPSKVIEPGVAQPIVNDVLPGGNKATLQLANGQKIILDSATNGSLAIQGNAKIVKLADGQIAYDVEGKVTAEVMYNTLRTPPGGQFKLKLPDGTDVWLNAASSITYPTAFVGKERTVTITGEAYFEVKSLTLPTGRDGGGQRKIPFIVDILSASGGGPGGRVEVLGTHFNINAYADEAAIKTTLLEGKVKVVNRESSIGNRQSTILKPGEQAVLKPYSPLTIDHSPDIDQVMAWKNGLFNFNKVSLQDVMKQIARWYGVDIVYQGVIKPKQFGGEIQRDLNLSEVLEGLKETGIHFRIEGKKLIVLP
jgi:ferric-dicitrate binding protein FerR (iron transport regulator)